MSLTDGGMIRKTKKNQVLLAIIKFIEKTLYDFNSGSGTLWRLSRMNKVRVQTWNFRDEIVDDQVLDVWTGLEDFLDDVYTRFSGRTLKRVSFEKVRTLRTQTPKERVLYSLNRAIMKAYEIRG